jgi:hypothetical protein
MEVKVRKISLTILGALLIAGSTAQAVSASDRDAKKAHRSSAAIHDQSRFRSAYDGPYYYRDYDYIPRGLQAERERNREDFGFGGWDRSWPGDFDPSLNPAD